MYSAPETLIRVLCKEMDFDLKRKIVPGGSDKGFEV